MSYWTAHGYWIGHGDPTPPAPKRYPCGGPHVCADCALQAQRAHADEQRKGMRMPLWLSLEPKPERLIGELRIIATRSRQCREELAAIPDDLSPMEVAMEALGIISRHADGCADELEALTADNARADDDGWKPTD